VHVPLPTCVFATLCTCFICFGVPPAQRSTLHYRGGHCQQSATDTQLQAFLCRPHAWRAIRKSAYAAAGITHVATSAQKQHRIVFLSGRSQNHHPEARLIVNEDDIAAAMRTRFPDVEVVLLSMRDLTPEQQLQELSTATVMISTLGSKSFRMVLMPDGAQVRPALHMRLQLHALTCLVDITSLCLGLLHARPAVVDSAAVTPHAGLTKHNCNGLPRC
jgi:Glycosyltransferase 61